MNRALNRIVSLIVSQREGPAVIKAGPGGGCGVLLHGNLGRDMGQKYEYGRLRESEAGAFKWLQNWVSCYVP